MIKNPGYISIFYQPGQGKARLRPSSTSFPIARQPNTANAQARKGVRFCLRTTLQEVCWILGGGTSALFFKSQLSERQKAASSGFWKMVLAESRRLRSSRRRSPAADRTALPSGPSRSPPPLLLHRLRTLRPGILLPLQLRQKTPKLISITPPGGPSAAIRILLNPKPLHIRCTLPGQHTETGYPHKPGSTPPKKHKPSNAAPAPGSPSLHQEKNYRQHHHR